METFTHIFGTSIILQKWRKLCRCHIFWLLTSIYFRMPLLFCVTGNHDSSFTPLLISHVPPTKGRMTFRNLPYFFGKLYASKQKGRWSESHFRKRGGGGGVKITSHEKSYVMTLLWNYNLLYLLNQCRPHLILVRNYSGHSSLQHI